MLLCSYVSNETTQVARFTADFTLRQHLKRPEVSAKPQLAGPCTSTYDQTLVNLLKHLPYHIPSNLLTNQHNEKNPQQTVNRTVMHALLYVSR